ncbi:MAG TPA: PEP-CTERM sorting domain-containing protein [Gemmataceae bacterium]|nr:PEP-CTERM sorting domain-containing protein [Gemmataceae bacterium]
MNRHSLMLGLRLAMLSALLSFAVSTPALAFFPPDNVTPHIEVPPPPPPQPQTPPPEQCCCCCTPPPTPHVRSPEPMTLVSSLIGLTVLGGLGLRKRFLGK